MHVHDYDMEFSDSKHSLDYVLRCKCGDTCSDMDEALRRMSASRAQALIVHLVEICLALAIVVIIVVILTGKYTGGA